MLILTVYILLSVLAVCCMFLSCSKDKTILVSVAKTVDSIMAVVGYTAVIYIFCFYFVAEWVN